MAIVDVVKAITVAAELTGAQMSGASIAVMAQDLIAQHGEAEILHALTRCRKELSRPLTASAVFDRLGEADGRPGADEAWAMALDAVKEELTVVWSDEMAEAFAIARPILSAGDKVGARMAFRDAYERICRQGREAGRRPAWRASLGWDPAQRRDCLAKAEAAGLLPAPMVAKLLPPPGGGVVEAALFGSGGGAVTEQVARWCAVLRAQLRKSQAKKQAAQ